jgi:hypothetical protein
MAIVQANAIAKEGNYAGAWECAEKLPAQFPADTKLKQARTDFENRALILLKPYAPRKLWNNKTNSGRVSPGS